MLAVYALVAAPPDPEALGKGLAGEPMRALACGTVHAIVGDVAAAPAFSARAAVELDALVKRLAAHADAILPVRFATVLADARALERVLDAQRAELEAALDLVRGRMQMSIRLMKPAGEPALPQEVSAGEPALGPGARYLSERLREHKRARSVPELDPIRERLARFIAAERCERHRGSPWFASVHHLVARGDVEAYAEAARLALPVLADGGINATLSGPWAPYAFAPEAMS